MENNGKIETQIPITDKDSQEIIIDIVMEGKSAYDVAVERGFDGTLEEWLLSLHGEPGYTPVKGVDYFDGKDGKDADVDGIQTQFDTVEERLDSTDAQLNNMTQDFTQHMLDYDELVIEVGKKANKVQEDWITPTLINATENVGEISPPLQYFKDNFGYVHVRGSVKNFPVSGGQATIAQLPSNYRPLFTLLFPGLRGTSKSGQVGLAAITPTGHISINRYIGANDTEFHFNCIFREGV